MFNSKKRVVKSSLLLLFMFIISLLSMAVTGGAADNTAISTREGTAGNDIEIEVKAGKEFYSEHRAFL